MNVLLSAKNLHVSVGDKEILRGVDLQIPHGEIHALMGPNGSGKSTLANVLMGHEGYEVTEGSILFEGKQLLELDPSERSQKGIFLAFQYPVAVPGLTLGTFLFRVLQAHGPERSLDPVSFSKELEKNFELLGIDSSFAERSLNDGFSGGEKKRCEILQLLMLRPKLAILDETDSGLDIDALKIVARGLEACRSPHFSALVITHYKRILDHIKVDRVHVMVDGKIVACGDSTLVDQLEEQGYSWLKQEVADTKKQLLQTGGSRRNQ